MAPLTSNTQATLLLTAPLIAGRTEPEEELLTLGEFNRLARLLREKQKEPADLLTPDSAGIIRLAATNFGIERLEKLLLHVFRGRSGAARQG